MKLGYVILYVQDVKKTLDFHEKAFGLETRFVLPSNDYGEMNLDGSTTLAFAAEEFVQSNIGNVFQRNRTDASLAPGAEISFVTDSHEDVPGAFQKALEAGAIAVQHPKEKPWGQVVSYVKDLNGVLVELCSPLGTSQ